MAVVSRIATIKFSNTALGDAGGFRQWQATAAVQDTAAGASVVVTVELTAGGTAPPAVTDTLTLEYRNDAGAVIKTVTLSNTATPQTDTFFFTANGLTGGGNRCGTVEIVLHAVKTTGGPTATYDAETDGAPNTPPALHTTTVLDRGWIRGTTTLVEDVSNVSLGGAEVEPAQYDESLFVRTTSGAISYVARALTVASSSGSLSSATNSTTAAQRDVTFANVVDNRFPAAVTTVNWTVTVQNSSLTGSPDWTYTSTTDDSIDVDPRLTCEHLLALNDDTFHTPPMADNTASGLRVFPDVGYLSTNIRAARGTFVGDAITGGVNGLTATITMDPQNPGSTVTYAGRTTGTHGGETGWAAVAATLDEWSQFPAGNWDKTVTITAPSDITGAAYLLDNTITYQFVAANPNFATIISLHPENISHHGTHFTVDDNFIPVVYVIDQSTDVLVALSGLDNITIKITREHHPTMRVDYFDFTTELWVAKANGAAIASELTLVRGSVHTVGGDPDIWTALNHLSGDLFAPDGAAGELDFTVIADAFVQGVHYFATIAVNFVGPLNKHNVQAPDEVSFLDKADPGLK